MRSFGPLFISCVFISFAGAAAISITQFGAISNDPSDSASHTNAVALLKTFQAANASATDRTVLVPSSGNFTVFPILLSSLSHVTLQVDGILTVNNNISSTAWTPGGVDYGVIHIIDSNNIEITGNGKFDGQGYNWWWYVFLTGKDYRPHLLMMERCVNVLIHNLFFTNSPQYHMLLEDAFNLVVRDLNIYVDVYAQQSMLASRGLLSYPEGADTNDVMQGLPIFPLNTDGIDPSGVNVLIENVTIENFDDAVAVKPMNGRGKYSSCSANMTIRNSRVVYSVGMTIGSVPPDINTNCIRDILFENIHFTNAIKAIYIKSNPGLFGNGIIDDITYQNITADGSLWYPIWIGPQQEQQPGTSGTGCSFFYPIIPTCPTQPLVSISNIKLHNVTLTKGLTLPGVLLCDPYTPCRGFVFENVVNTGTFLVNQTYVCENIEDSVNTGNTPKPSCF